MSTHPSGRPPEGAHSLTIPLPPPDWLLFLEACILQSRILEDTQTPGFRVYEELGQVVVNRSLLKYARTLYDTRTPSVPIVLSTPRKKT